MCYACNLYRKHERNVRSEDAAFLCAHAVSRARICAYCAAFVRAHDVSHAPICCLTQALMLALMLSHRRASVHAALHACTLRDLRSLKRALTMSWQSSKVPCTAPPSISESAHTNVDNIIEDALQSDAESTHISVDNIRVNAR